MSNTSVLQTAETDDLFDPLEDSQTLNTFTRRDHLFARLDFVLEKASVTLYHQAKMKPLLNESGVIQLEFSGAAHFFFAIKKLQRIAKELR